MTQIRTTRKITVSAPADVSGDVTRPVKREKADDPFSEERILEIIEDAKRNPMTPEEAEAEFLDLARYGAAQAKKLGIKERDIPEMIHRFRVCNRASQSRSRH